MTKKRFTFTQDTLAKADVFDGGEFVCCTLSVWVEQLVELLNQLNDENEQSKSDYDTLQIQDDARKQYQKELMKENEQLKSELEYYKALVHTQ